MTQIQKDNGYGRIDTFTVVEKVPAHYCVWNIGVHHAPHGYIPFVEVDENYNVNPNTMLAVAVDRKTQMEAMRYASFGLGSLDKIVKVIRNSSGAKLERAKRAFNLFSDMWGEY